MIGGLLDEGRRLAEELMRDECAIVRKSDGATDPDTGQWSETTTAVYSGKCQVQVQDSLDPQSPDYGGAEVTLQRAAVSIPIAVGGVATAPRVRDVVTITAVDPVDGDPDLVGAEYTVAAIHRKTRATARRLRVEEVTAG